MNICLSTIKDHPLYVNNEIKRFTFIQTIRTGNVVIKTKILSISLQCISIPIEYYVVGKENGHFYCSHLIFMPFRIGSNKTGTVISLSAGRLGPLNNHNSFSHQENAGKNAFELLKQIQYLCDKR